VKSSYPLNILWWSLWAALLSSRGGQVHCKFCNP